MAGIADFKANMKFGGARNNQFRVIATLPQGLVGSAQVAGQRVQFMAKAASIPASSIADVEVMYRGRPVHFAGERTFQPWNITIYNDNDFVVRNAFEEWVNGIGDAASTTGVLTPAEYQTDLEVQQLSRNDEVLKSYRFFDAYPVEVGDIQLSWDQNNSIQEFNVTFVYNFWEAISQ